MTNFSWCVYCFYYLSRLASTKSSQARPLCQMFVSHLRLWCQMLCSRPSRGAFSSSSPKVELTPIIIFTGDATGHIIWWSFHFCWQAFPVLMCLYLKVLNVTPCTITNLTRGWLHYLLHLWRHFILLFVWFHAWVLVLKSVSYMHCMFLDFIKGIMKVQIQICDKNTNVW